MSRPHLFEPSLAVPSIAGGALAVAAGTAWMIWTIDSHAGITASDVLAFPGWIVLWAGSFLGGADGSFGLLFGASLLWGWLLWSLLFFAIGRSWNRWGPPARRRRACQIVQSGGVECPVDR